MKKSNIILFEIADIKGKYHFYAFDEKMARNQYKLVFPKGKIITVKIIPSPKFKPKKK